MTALNLGIVSTNYTWKRSYELLMLNRMNYVCLPNFHYLYFFAFFFAVLANDNAIATDWLLDLPDLSSLRIFFEMLFCEYPLIIGLIVTPSYITWVREGTYPQSLVSNIEQNGNE